MTYDPNPATPAVAIGDITVVGWEIFTPNGSAPIGRSRWIAIDNSRTESHIPTFAIVLAILFAVFCLLGLLFLLVKETTTTGYVEVRVDAHGLHHVTQIPVRHASDVAQARSLVAWAQSLAARAPA